MKAKVIQIGNSKGLRLPKTILELYEIGKNVELVPTENGILIKPLKEPRAGWEAKFKQMHENGQDKMLE